jgi:hypothetical protein
LKDRAAELAAAARRQERLHRVAAGLRRSPPGTTIIQSTDRSLSGRMKRQQIHLFPKSEALSDGNTDHPGARRPRTELTTHLAAI